MGNTHQGRDTLENGDPQLIANQSAPILFHATHSASLQLSLTRRLVKRFDSCKGICFTSRPIDIGERICVRIVESSNSWKGALRFGFTCDDPASINASDLPKFACPDLTFEQGYWAKAVPESIVRQGNILFFYLNHDGRVIFGVNGEARGQLFSGVKTDILLWALMDVYGNTTAIELVDVLQLSTTSLNSASSNSSNEQHPPTLGRTSAKSAPRTASLPPRASNLPRRASSPPPGAFSGHPPGGVPGHAIGASTPSPIQRHVEGCAYLRSLSRAEHSSNTPDANNVTAVTEGRSSERRIVEVIRPMSFHYTIGRNITLSANRTVATRLPQEYCNGYVFTAEPLLPGERLILGVLKVDATFCGGLAFGVTSCDPATVRLAELTDDSDLLLDRPEYWVVRKDVCTKAAVNDELVLHLTERGEVRYSRNGRNAGVLMHVDCSLPLWAFIDVYGMTQEIQCRGVARRSKHRPTSRQLSSPPDSLPDPNPPSLHSLALATPPARTLSTPGEVATSVSTNRRHHHHHHGSSRSANATPSPSVGGDQPGEGAQDLTGGGFQIGAMPLNAITPFLGVHQRACLMRNGASQPGGLGGSGVLPGVAGAQGVTASLEGNRGDWTTSQSRRRASSILPQGAELDPPAQGRADGAVRRGEQGSETGTTRRGQQGSAGSRALNTRASQHGSVPSFHGVDFFNSAPFATLPAPLIPVPSAAATAAAAIVPATAAVAAQNALSDTALHGGASSEVGAATHVRSSHNVTSSLTHQNSLKVAEASSHSGSNTRTSVDRYGPLAALSADLAAAENPLEPLVDLSLPPVTVGASDWLGGNSCGSECVVCLERPADSALYTCGHMCMCYTCAQGLVRSKKPLCPICRQPIQDVIKIFRS